MTTLYAALKQHYLDNPDFESPDEFADPYRTLLHGHDLIHIVYGADTSLWGENCAELITMLKTDFGAWNYLQFWNSPQGRKTVNRFVRMLGIGRILLALAMLPVALVYVLFRTRRQTQTFPFYEYIGDTKTSIEDIRSKYNIVPFNSTLLANSEETNAYQN